MKRLVVLLAGVTAAIGLAIPVSAEPEPIPPYCERVAIFGLNPYIRIICDQPILDDGSWMRARLSHYLESTRSSCGGQYYQGGDCPPWLEKDVIPEQFIEDEYRVTWDTIPPGEPGHLG